MERTFTIEDVAAFTGLTDRTLRTYLQEGRLAGEKVDGAWRFSPGDVQRLFQDAGAQRAMEANRNALVYDFMLGGMAEDRCCLIRDIPVDEGGEEALRQRLLGRVNREEGRVSFAYSYGVDRRGQGTARVILTGPTALVRSILADM